MLSSPRKACPRESGGGDPVAGLGSRPRFREGRLCAGMTTEGVAAECCRADAFGLHGRGDTIVLDPFMGTGTAIVAAESERASGIRIDVNRNYAAISLPRLVESGHVQHSLADV